MFEVTSVPLRSDVSKLARNQRGVEIDVRDGSGLVSTDARKPACSGVAMTVLRLRERRRRGFAERVTIVGGKRDELENATASIHELVGDIPA